MKRFNSDPYHREGTAVDHQSSILGGNLNEVIASVDSLSDEEDFDQEELLFSQNKSCEAASDEVISQNATCTEEEFRKADSILFDIFGINLVSVFVKLLLSGKILPKEFVVQGLAYRCQSLVRGISGVRYQKEWGLFWAACRTIVKTRGLICFRDHFCVPSMSQLVKFKKDILKMCGLEESSIGKSGLHSQSTDLWINSKSKELDGATLALSVSIDGKKISVTKEGTEDMGGIESYMSKDGETELLEKEIMQMTELLKTSSRQSLFNLYDMLSSTSQEVISKVSGLKILETTNLKRLEKNPTMSKYIHVLRCQIENGGKLVEQVCDVQSSVVQLMAEKRNSSHLLPKQTTNFLLPSQANYVGLEVLSLSTNNKIISRIEMSVKTKSLLDVPWSTLQHQVGDLFNISRESGASKKLLELCYLSSEQIFLACGLGSERPVQDMKNIYTQSHSFPSTLKLSKSSDSNIVGSLCATMAPMTFGTNCVIKESGLHIRKGICSAPDQMLFTGGDNLEFTTLICTGRVNIFDVDLQTIAQCCVDSFICGSRKGCIVLQYSDQALVAVNVPPNNSLAEDMLSLCESYVRAVKCLSRRSKEMIAKQELVKTTLKGMKENLKILGSYPLFDKFKSLDTDESRRKVPISPTILRQLMQNKKNFLAKQARELVAINLSEMSGNASDAPHTVLAATFLSSTSLKTIGEKCLNEVIKMVEVKNCKCLNIGVDGESLHLASNLPDGTPGTELSLAKTILKKLQSINKENLMKIVQDNHSIAIDDVPVQEEEEDMEEQIVEENMLANMEESLAAVQDSHKQDDSFSLEEIEDMLKFESIFNFANDRRDEEIKKLTVAELRIVCLKYILPRIKRKWLLKNIGHEKITVFFPDGNKLDYSPCNVFHKSSEGIFRTVTFDYAHLINLYRESASKGKLQDMGLSAENLVKLSKMEGFKYLETIIALKNGKLKYDSMNQKAAAALFSEKTVTGLKVMKDHAGAKCVDLIATGLSAFDESGRCSEDRVKDLVSLKDYLVEKNNILERMKRPNSRNITNELYTMTLVSIDSHLFTYLNMEFFHPRRKSTSTVEMLFGQITMLTDGSSRLNVRQLQDVLQRVTISSALRSLPSKVRGFQFLGQLKMHMKSYEPPDEEEDSSYVGINHYPKLTLNQGSLCPKDSSFDRPSRKKKRKFTAFARESSHADDVRKFHEKF